MNRKNILSAGILGALFALMYVPIWEWMYQRYTATDTYYSHGFLIPLISLFLLYRKRTLLVEAFKDIDGGKIIFIFFGMGMLLLSALWRFYFLGGLSMLVILYGSIDYLFGVKVRKLFFFPIIFLFFMVPIPEAWIAVINLKLKFFATAIAVRIVDFTGIIIVQEGSKIFISSGVMTVGDVCSGLRSLISLLAFGALFSYMCNIKLWKKYLLFLIAFPCAIASNVIRITSLCFVAEWFDIPTATGKFHDISGLGVFVVAFCIMFAMEKIISGKKTKGSV